MSNFLEFTEKYPDEASCLEEIFDMRYKNLKYCYKCGAESQFYRIKERLCYSCKWCGHQIYPLVGTIFERTHVSLRSWLFVIYLFSISKHGVSAAEVQRHVRVSYKTAFRMTHLVRGLMIQPETKLEGVVEADEAYLGGRMIQLEEKRYWKNQAVILGAVQRKGEARVALASGASATTVIPFLQAKVQEGSKLYTDDSRVYHHAKRHFYHESVNHVRHQYAKGVVHSNTMEGFWSHLKRSIRGTYHGVSYKYLQFYINEAVWRYNYRDVGRFTKLLYLSYQL